MWSRRGRHRAGRQGAGRPSAGVRIAAEGPFVIAVDLGVDRAVVARVGGGEAAADHVARRDQRDQILGLCFAAQVVDQRGLLARMAADDLRRLQRGRVVLALAAQDLGPAGDHVEWRAQLVRDDRDELIAQALGLLQWGNVLEDTDHRVDVALAAARAQVGAVGEAGQR